MLILVLIAIVILFFCVALLLAIFLVFISAGIISVSALAGIYKRSFTKGFKVLILLSASAGGILIAIFLLFCGQQFLNWWTDISFLSASVIGLVAGYISGFLFIYLLSKTVKYLKIRYAGIKKWGHYNERDIIISEQENNLKPAWRQAGLQS